MTFIRNLMTALGVVSIIAICIFVFRPDVYNSAFSKPVANPTPVAAGQVYCMLSAQRGTLIEDSTAPTNDAMKFTLSELVEGEAVDVVPPSITPFLMVVNKAKNELRYWKLNKNVRKVTLRDNSNAAFDVKFKELASTPTAPFQAVLWIPRETDLKLKFELGATK